MCKRQVCGIPSVLLTCLSCISAWTAPSFVQDMFKSAGDIPPLFRLKLAARLISSKRGWNAKLHCEAESPWSFESRRGSKDQSIGFNAGSPFGVDLLATVTVDMILGEDSWVGILFPQQVGRNR